MTDRDRNESMLRLVDFILDKKRALTEKEVEDFTVRPDLDAYEIKQEIKDLGDKIVEITHELDNLKDSISKASVGFSMIIWKGELMPREDIRNHLYDSLDKITGYLEKSEITSGYKDMNYHTEYAKQRIDKHKVNKTTKYVSNRSGYGLPASVSWRHVTQVESLPLMIERDIRVVDY